jgi:hypothetical protein
MSLLRSFSTFPIHGYFLESKRWGDSKFPKLYPNSTITFGGFIDRVKRRHDDDRTLFSVDVEVVNLAFISTQTGPQMSPNRNRPLYFFNSHLLTSNPVFMIQDPQVHHIQQHHALDGIIKNLLRLLLPSTYRPHPKKQ